MKSSAMPPQPRSVTREFLLFLSIPLAVIVILAAVLQGPSLFARPKYDFLYNLCANFDCDGSYVVTADGQLTYQPDNSAYGYGTKPTLYYYSEQRHAAKQITFSEAAAYSLDSTNVSPDGYMLWQNNGNDSGFLLWGGSGDGNWYLKDGAKKKQLNLTTSGYGDDVHFLGWVKQ